MLRDQTISQHLGHTRSTDSIGLSEGVSVVEWCFETGGGAVSVRQEGDRVICQALRSAQGEGLYKAWLRGERGRFLLGTLIPEGGALRLRRSVPIAQLRSQGVWPPTGAEIAMAFSFTGKKAPDGFCWEEKPWCLTQDPLLIPCLRSIGRCLIQKSSSGFVLAFPFDAAMPFPLPPLFCLGQAAVLNEEKYLLFSFSPDGKPLLPQDRTG